MWKEPTKGKYRLFKRGNASEISHRGYRTRKKRTHPILHTGTGKRGRGEKIKKSRKEKTSASGPERQALLT